MGRFLHGIGNGWGFWRCHCPAGNPWDDFESGISYQMVYPGPRGPVATRQSEALREGWEDWCLLNLLKEKGLDRILKELLRAYEAGTPVEELRLKGAQSLFQGREFQVT